MPSTERKKNRLAGYDYSQPGAYFITVCVKDHRCLLSNVVGADDHIGPHVALTEIGKTVEKYTRSIPGIAEYVIMPNHVHMILRISGKDTAQGPMWASAPTGKRIENLVRSWKILITKELGHVFGNDPIMTTSSVTGKTMLSEHSILSITLQNGMRTSITPHDRFAKGISI